VLDVPEAAVLRDAGVTLPILLLAGLAGPAEADAAVRLALTPVIHHRGGLELAAAAAARADRPLAVQVEIDTGMRRMGVPGGEALAVMQAVASDPGLALEGVFTHFACADDPDPGACLEQLAAFGAILEDAAAAGLRPGQVHADNSAGLLTGKVLGDALAGASAVRPGLMLYGVKPAPHLDPRGVLRPVMSLYAPVSFRARVATRVATLRCGYADGYIRASGNRGRVWLAGERRPVVGRVSMDYITVDVGDAPVRIGDEAVVLGAADPSRGIAAGGIAAEEAAAHAGTLGYELLVRVGARVPREIIG
jgi:alanine racemase